MDKVSHLIWLIRWFQRLCQGILRGRRVLDLCPSILLPTKRLIYDRVEKKFRLIVLREELGDYWSFDHCLAITAFDIRNLPQAKFLAHQYGKMLLEGRVPVILDCGANIGLSCYWFAKTFPEAIVIGVEPDFDNYLIAKKNTESCKNSRVVLGAVASEDCQLQITNSSGGKDAFRVMKDVSGSVAGLSVETLLEREGFTAEDLLLVKIDIEGFENELFSRNISWVEHAHTIILEPHDWMLPGSGGTQSFLRAILDKPRDIVVHGEHLVCFRI